MKKLTPLLASLLVGGMLSFGSPSVSRADPLLELGLAIDASGSINSANFTLQKNGYINVLSNSSILPLDGSVAIGVVVFSDTVHLVFPTTVITAATIGSLINAIQTNLIDYTGSTAIGDAINFLANDILTNSISSGRQVIDVSTDGGGNAGVNQIVAANGAVAAGIDQINCLGIGTSATCDFNRGAGSFSVMTNDFASLESTLVRKITAEVNNTPIPEPGSLAILGLGLIGIAGLRRTASTWMRLPG